MELNDLVRDAGEIAAFGGVGLVLMALGFGMVDVLTPGKLHELVWGQRNANAALLVASNLFAVALIVTTAVRSSYDGLGDGLLSAFVYGLLGLIVMGVCFVLVDALTPGKLGALLTGEDRHPAVWVTASAHLGIALIVCAAIY